MGLLSWLSSKKTPERSYQAAKATHLTSKMHREARAVVDPLRTFLRDGKNTRQVGRWLYMNTPAARRTVRFMAQRVIGPEGILPQFTDEKIDEAFRVWAMRCRRGNRKTWSAAQTMLLSEFITAGEGFHRRDVRDGRLEIVAFEPEQLSTTAPGRIPEGRVFSMGIEYDEFGIATRYFVERKSPETGFLLGVDPFNAIRVVHLYMEDRPGQLRGISQFATGAVSLYDMSDAVYAELTALRMQAYAGLHFKPEADESGVIDDMATDEVPQDAPRDPIKEIAMEAGQIIDYAGDVHLLSSNRPGGAFLPFVSKLVADWAVSVGIPTWVVEGDYSKANYSSMRAAEQSCRPTFEEVQNLIIDVQARPDVESWLTWAVLTNQVSLPAGQTVATVMRDVEWQKPGFPYVDPLKEIQSDQLMMSLGLKTFDQACAERGLHGRDQRWRIMRSRELDAETGVTTPGVGAPVGLSGNPGGVDEAAETTAQD